MAKSKKSSSNAIKKLDKQIKDLTVEKEVEEKINKKDLEQAVKKATTPKKSTTKKANSSTKKKTTAKKSTAKKTTTKNKTTSKKTATKKTTTKKNVKKEAVVAPEREKKVTAREITAEEVKKVVEKNKNSKYNKKQLSESTMKMKKLERHMRSLYDKVSSVVEDIDYVKTIDSKQDVMIADVEAKNQNILSKVDDLSTLLLHKLTMILGVIFIVYAIIVIGIIIYICTY